MLNVKRLFLVLSAGGAAVRWRPHWRSLLKWESFTSSSLSYSLSSSSSSSSPSSSLTTLSTDQESTYTFSHYYGSSSNRREDPGLGPETRDFAQVIDSSSSLSWSFIMVIMIIVIIMTKELIHHHDEHSLWWISCWSLSLPSRSSRLSRLKCSLNDDCGPGL